jgi:hypothetical protein
MVAAPLFVDKVLREELVVCSSSDASLFMARLMMWYIIS